MATLNRLTNPCGEAYAIQIMTMKVSKGLKFRVVALSSVGHMPAKGEDEQEAARVFYVAAMRATHKLMITVSGKSHFYHHPLKSNSPLFESEIK